MKGQSKKAFFIRLLPWTSVFMNIKKYFCCLAIFFNHINSASLLDNKPPSRSIASMSHR